MTEEELAWALCPVLRAFDEEDMPVILHGPYSECRKCKVHAERHGGTTGCRLVAGIVAKTALKAME